MLLKKRRLQKTYFTAELSVRRMKIQQFICKNSYFLNFIAGPEENVASAKFNSKTIRGELRSALLDGEVTNYDMEKGTEFFFQ